MKSKLTKYQKHYHDLTPENILYYYNKMGMNYSYYVNFNNKVRLRDISEEDLDKSISLLMTTMQTSVKDTFIYILNDVKLKRRAEKIIKIKERLCLK